jgi:2,5-diamino-6-(ribosylamino)-4(3H)-pyrimidinone 5'-phosphate reductase
MRPHVILHNEVSLDGRLDGLPPDLGRFYAFAARLREGATLAGCDTLLAAVAASPPDSEESPPPAAPDPGDARPLLVVPDSRGRLRHWNHLRAAGPWRDGVALCSRRTPAEHLARLARQRVAVIVAGEDHVDLEAALAELAGRHGVKRVRVDAGGTLNGVLLRADLVDEVSLLVDATLVGGLSPRSFFRAEDLASKAGVKRLELLHVEQLEDHTLWLRYAVVRPAQENPITRAHRG